MKYSDAGRVADGVDSGEFSWRTIPLNLLGHFVTVEKGSNGHYQDGFCVSHKSNTLHLVGYPQPIDASILTVCTVGAQGQYKVVDFYRDDSLLKGFIERIANYIEEKGVSGNSSVREGLLYSIHLLRDTLTTLKLEDIDYGWEEIASDWGEQIPDEVTRNIYVTIPAEAGIRRVTIEVE